jgi:hypothetical protein
MRRPLHRRDRVGRLRRPVVADAGGGLGQRNGWIGHNFSSEERGKDGKIDWQVRTRFRHPRVRSRPPTQYADAELVFRQTDRSQRARRPHPVDRGRLAIDLGAIFRRPVKRPAPVVWVRFASDTRLRHDHRAELVNQRWHQGGAARQAHHVETWLRPNQYACGRSCSNRGDETGLRQRKKALMFARFDRQTVGWSRGIAIGATAADASEHGGSEEIRKGGKWGLVQRSNSIRNILGITDKVNSFLVEIVSDSGTVSGRSSPAQLEPSRSRESLRRVPNIHRGFRTRPEQALRPDPHRPDCDTRGRGN